MPDTSAALSDAVVGFLDARNMVSVATIDPDGKPRQTVTWFRLESDGRILINGRLPRRWCANLLRDPRVSLSIIDAGNGLRWVGLVGVVNQVVDDLEPARDDIEALANRYSDGVPDPAGIAAFRSQPRLSYYIRVTGVYEHLEG